MSQFFEKNKRKSWLALLLLLLRGRKGAGALLLLVFLMMFLFVLPQNALSLFVAGIAAKLPGGAGIARRLSGGGTDFSNLMAAFRAAKDQRNAGWGVFFDADAAKRGRGARGESSSIDMIKGGREDFLAGSNLGAGNKVKGGETIGGIMTPEESAKSANGVAVSAEDAGGEREAQLASMGGSMLGPSVGGKNFWQNGLLKISAGLGAFGFGKGESSGARLDMSGGAGAGGAGSTAGAFAGKGFFSGGTGASNADPAGQGLSGTVPPGGAIGSGKLPGAARGRLAAELAKASNTTRLAASTRSAAACVGSRCAFHQLAAGRTSMMLSRDPICTASNGCPPEFAATNSGTSFDGNTIPSGPDAPKVITSGDPATAPVIDGITTPNVNVPDVSQVDQYQQEAEQLQRDANACRDVDAKYNDQERQLRSDMHDIGDAMTDRGCGDGSCSRSKARWCKGKANELKAKCRELNDVEYNHCLECPLRARQGCKQNAHDCS